MVSAALRPFNNTTPCTACTGLRDRERGGRERVGGERGGKGGKGGGGEDNKISPKHDGVKNSRNNDNSQTGAYKKH